MRGLRYLDFDLMFERQEQGYSARVLSSPAGQASGDFNLPFSDLEIENFLLRFGRPRQAIRRLGSPQIDSARVFGGRLFEAVFQSEIRSCLRSSLDEAQRQEVGLRIRLRMAGAPELNDLPWEFLLQPSLGRFLALSAETPLVRYLDLPERVRPLSVSPPLEVLSVISSPEEYAALDVEAEWRKLGESLGELQQRGLLRLHRLATPTLAHLQRWLRKETCHILHFIGHGGFDARTEEGLLLFADEKGRGREVSGAELGTLLHDHRPLRLAVLNACEGARSSRTDPFAGVAQSLVREGIPAVVAMQFEITDLAAITFSHELYGAIVDGYPIDAALGEARKALYLGGHELEWGTPVLYMRSPDGQLFEIDPAKSVKALNIHAQLNYEIPASASKAEVVAVGASSLPVLNVVTQAFQEPASKFASPTPSKLSVVEEAQANSIPRQAPPTPWQTDAAPYQSMPPLSLARRQRWIRLAALVSAVVFAALYFLVLTRQSSSVQEAGVYVTISVSRGELIKPSVLQIIDGTSATDQPLRLSDVVNGCFASDLVKGHRLAWSDIGKCL